MNDKSVNSSSIVSDRIILVCQGRCCRKDGSKQLLRLFQSQTPPNIQVISCGCLGQCGNGPNVLILPDKIWYQQVFPQDVSLILNRFQ